MGELSRRAANFLQNLYEHHRVPETWGTPEISRYVFQAVRTQGFLAGWRELTRRLQAVGLPGLSTTQKILALVGGISLVTLADRFLPHEEKRPITHRARRTFSSQAWKPAVVLYTLGAALLVAANEREGGGGGRWRGTVEGGYGDIGETTEVEATHRPDEEDGASTRWDPGAVLDEWDETDDPPSGRN